MDIDWRGRGADRGLRGIAFHDETVYIAASDELFAYTPDFRLTECGLYIEHFGVRKTIDANGSIQFETAPFVPREQYLQDMEWKRNTHKKYGTVLVETFSYERVEGRLLRRASEPWDAALRRSSSRARFGPFQLACRSH